MARKLFRKLALDRLASPDRTDHPVRLIGAPDWLILFAFAAAIVAGAIWAIRTEAPVKVRAVGILIDQAGLVEIVSEQGGLLERVLLKPGDTVEPGEVVARLSRSELRRELAEAEAELEDLEDRDETRRRTNAASAAREAAQDTLRLSTIAATRDALTERLALLRERAEKLEPLVERKVIPEIKFIEAQIEVSDVEERLAALNEDAKKIEVDAAERQASRDLATLEDQLKIESQERTVARLRERLSEEQVIVSTHHGTVAEIKVNPGDVLTPGMALATLAPIGDGQNLLALMYVPPADGKRIEAGMTAEIAPTTVEQEVFGHIVGEVLSVSPLPATPEGMRRALQNDQLVEQLSLGGAPIEVRLTLKRDPDTPTGFRWSSSAGPIGGVNAGTLLRGKVIIDERPLIDLVLPGASTTLGAADSGER